MSLCEHERKVQPLVISKLGCGARCCVGSLCSSMPDQCRRSGDVSVGRRCQACRWHRARGSPQGFYMLSKGNKPDSYVRLVPKLFYKCDQGQADPVVAVARDQSSVYLTLLMHETQPPSHFSVSTVTRYASRGVGALMWSLAFSGENA